jgi:tripartite-type tricarboxylate transporter receptor subunit TctC
MNALLARLACSLTVVAGLAAVPAAQAQGTNAGKPMHIVVTFTPGGAPDILARLIGEKLSIRLEPAGADRQQARRRRQHRAPTRSRRRAPTG